MRTIGVTYDLTTARALSDQFNINVEYAGDELIMWDPPRGTFNVVIYIDRLPGFKGEADAYRLAYALSRDGFNVDVKFPPDCCSTWMEWLAPQDSLQV